MDDLIKAYLAKGGSVTKCAVGDRSTTEREMYVARHSSGKLRGMSAEDRAIAERHYVVGSNGVEHCHNGLGEWLY